MSGIYSVLRRHKRVTELAPAREECRLKSRDYWDSRDAELTDDLRVGYNIFRIVKSMLWISPILSGNITVEMSNRGKDQLFDKAHNLDMRGKISSNRSLNLRACCESGNIIDLSFPC